MLLTKDGVWTFNKCDRIELLHGTASLQSACLPSGMALQSKTEGYAAISASFMLQYAAEK